MDDIYRSQFRLPYPLYEQLKQAADTNRRSVNAELVARLQETFAIDEALQSIAPGSPVEGTSLFLLQLDKELEEAREEVHHLNLAVHAKDMHEQLTHNNAMLEKIQSRIEYLIEQTKAGQK